MGVERSMRFALQLTGAEDGEAWSGLVRRAESTGFHVVSAPDHLDGQFAPLLALAAASTVTTTVRLSTFVLAIGLRHLGMLAKEVATLDVLSGGRVEIGLGAGWAAAEFAALGLPFPGAGDRVSQLAEAVPLLRALWRGEVVSADGPHYRMTELQIDPVPLQPGGVPVVLGGGGRKVLSLAGREADVVSIAPGGAGRTQATALADGLQWPSVRQQVSWVMEAAADRQTPPELNLRILAVTPAANRAAAAELLAAERGSSPTTLIDSPFLLLGRPGDMVEQLLRARDDLGVTYFTVSQRHSAAFSEVMARL